MEVTREQLIDCGVSPTKATIYAPIISMWSSNFAITTPMRMCHFLSQVLWESCCFRYTKELARYDASSNVNAFSVGGVWMWIPADKRAILRTSIDAYKALGQESVTKVWEGKEYTFPTDTWLLMINSVEVYASECFNTTERHRAAINAMTTVADVEAYDFTTGYPEKLQF